MPHFFPGGLDSLHPVGEELPLVPAAWRFWRMSAELGATPEGWQRDARGSGRVQGGSGRVQGGSGRIQGASLAAASGGVVMGMAGGVLTLALIARRGRRK